MSSGSKVNSIISFSESAGYFFATFGLIIGIIVGGIMIFIGFGIIFSKNGRGSVGFILLIIGLLIIGSSYLIYYLVQKYPEFAAIYGLASMVNVVTGGNYVLEKQKKNT